MNLHELAPVMGSTHVDKRKGRGTGTGNGKTSGAPYPEARLQQHFRKAPDRHQRGSSQPL